MALIGDCELTLVSAVTLASFCTQNTGPSSLAVRGREGGMILRPQRFFEAKQFAYSTLPAVNSLGKELPNHLHSFHETVRFGLGVVEIEAGTNSRFDLELLPERWCGEPAIPVGHLAHGTGGWVEAPDDPARESARPAKKPDGPLPTLDFVSFCGEMTA
jgi:hypothetical protein